MIHILTYQDFEAATNKADFLVKAIEEYRQSDMFLDAVVAQAYYERRNIEILNRLSYVEKMNQPKRSKVKFHKLCSGYFPKFVKQEAQYLLGNGVTLDEAVKEKLGPKFDKDLQRAGTQALVDAVNWGFWSIDHLLVFRATEFCPLLDEMTSDLKAGIRFFQIAENKPMYIELFEIEGITKYKKDSESGTAVEIQSRTAYKHKVIQFENGTEEPVDNENYPVIPIFPLYANELKQSELTQGIKSLIDAYDFISSDLIDGIDQVEGVYWVLKNFGGDNVSELLEEIRTIKATYTSRETSDVDNHVIEAPYQAKHVALELLEKQLYADYMALDIKALTGGSLTNVAINVAKTDFDLKCDIFEWQCSDFVENILKLLGIEGETIQFKRRSITNDTETIDNISTMISDGYVDDQWAIENNPIIPDEDQKELLDRVLLAKEQQAQREYQFEDDNDSGDDNQGDDDE